MSAFTNKIQSSVQEHPMFRLAADSQEAMKTNVTAIIHRIIGGANAGTKTFTSSLVGANLLGDRAVYRHVALYPGRGSKGRLMVIQ
jgi:hypothetical protein